MKTAVVVTTKDRPQLFAKSFPSIAAAADRVGAEILVVDDGSEPALMGPAGYHYLYVPTNRGLAGALNIGLSFWLADPDVQAISYFQDDVEVDPLCLAVMNALCYGREDRHVYTGHDAKEHAALGPAWLGGEGIFTTRKVACRATHMHARREAWASVMPLRSKGLGLPKRIPGRPGRGEGSGVDWWVVRDNPKPLPVVCVPGLVRTFAFKAADSCWANDQVAGEDAPLSRDAIQDWLNRQAPRDGEANVNL